MNFRKTCLLALAIFIVSEVKGQFLQTEAQWIETLKLSGGFPPKLLSTRSFVFHSHLLNEKDLNDAQEYFQRTGIDAVGYLPLDLVMAGKDVTKAVWDYLLKREIVNLIFIEKLPQQYRLSITTFSGKENIFEPQQPAWSVANRVLVEALKVLNRSALVEFRKENLLVNNFPETDITINPILGKRNEFYAVDMKVDMVAVPKFGVEAMDKELGEIFAANFPFEYKLVEPGIPEKELRKQGFLYILCFVHTRGELAKDLLGYKITKPETAIVSVTYREGKQQLATIPSNAPVFKVYFKHIDSGNIFLGTKWDADETWQQALLNNIKNMKAELRLN